MNFITTIYAQSVYDPREQVERTYTVSAESKIEAEIKALNKFWNEIDCISYSYVDQDTEEAS
jgi:hypothetical protein